MTRNTDTRAVTLVDLPLIRRLSDQATVLDSEIICTGDTPGLGVPLLPQRRLYTLVSRSDKQQVIGQFQMHPDDPNAHIVYVAPHLRPHVEDTLWLRVLDAMAQEAGKHNAHTLLAEVEEEDPLFETLRTSGFAVYARQQIWRRAPAAHAEDTDSIPMREVSDHDVPSVHSLMSLVIPRLMQQVCTLPSHLDGWIYQEDEQCVAYIDVSVGRQGIYMTPYLHPDLDGATAADVFDWALRFAEKVDRLPVYVRVRRYQEWIASVLEEMDFEAGPRQAVMVRHIAAGVRHPTFQTVKQGLAALVGPPAPPNRVIKR